MTLLDDQELLVRNDSLGILATVEGFASQIERGWTLGSDATGLPDGAGGDSVVVMGMGGSAAAGDIVRAVIEDRLPLPFVVWKGYGPLPEWVGRNTLAVALSYSGNTEETVDALDDAIAKGARLVAISSGGRLEERAGELGAAHVAVPGGLQPRAALGLLALPLLAVLQKVGLVPSFDDDVAAAADAVADRVSSCARTVPEISNPAKALARSLSGRVPVIYGGRGVGAAIAYRFKCDINEYAETPAFCNEVPEMGHNEICSWASPATRDDFVGVFIRDGDEHPRVATRFDITRTLVEPGLASIVELTTSGAGRLERMMTTLLETQFAAVYLGLLRGVDPGPVATLDRLKRELAASEGVT